MLNKILRFVIVTMSIIAGLMMTDRIIPFLAPLVSVEFLQTGIFGITLTTILSFLTAAFWAGLSGFCWRLFC
ncbi:hypothetical protein ALO_16032 [Acetonema longum DSM 6540]|uniref:Uncharacterized protein n=1 Tax=Acetonema longum DSM 6540 TaxID=1009370 RepID=F7NM79_9FIRM|nr:hypothetical protein ALO_16032 [Acetonema longum DSM 6540]